MVEAAARVEGVDDVAAEDRLDRPERATGDGGGRLVHPGERRHVAEPGDPEGRRTGRVLAEATDRGDVLRRVDDFELGVARRLGGQPRLGADRPEQVDPRPEPARGQRVARAEVVRRRTRAEDEQRAVGA